MFLYDELCSRNDTNNPVRVGLIGAGKFGSMFLAQVPTTAGLEVSIIADLDPAKAKRSCADVGWPDELISRTEYVDDAMVMMTSGKVDVLVEATGNPAIGVVHARAAIRNGIHIVMVNVEADVLAGAQLAQEAASAGVVYSMAYGDQPALTCELVDWARSNGFNVVAAGKGTKFLPSYHASTPDTVWDHYGMTAEQATAAGMNSQIFNSFLDGTKSALEMAAIANATGLAAPDDGLLFPPAGMDDLAQVLRPRAVGGQLDASGMVEVVSSLERDGRPVFKDLRWGVYVVIEAPNDYTASCFRQYGMNTDETGRYSAMYKPFHLIGLELNISILSAALLGKATGSTKTFTGDVVATAKRQLKAGEILDGEGGYTVWGKLYPAYRSLQMDGLPIGLAQNVRLITDVPENAPVRWQDVEIDHSLEAIKIRRALEQASARLHP
jgi:predicted homoserine dehydrogenase-like protein